MLCHLHFYRFFWMNRCSCVTCSVGVGSEERDQTHWLPEYTQTETHIYLYEFILSHSFHLYPLCVCARLSRLVMCWNWRASFYWFHWIKRHFLSPIMNQRLPGASVSVSSLHTTQPLHSDIKWVAKVVLIINEF